MAMSILNGLWFGQERRRSKPCISKHRRSRVILSIAIMAGACGALGALGADEIPAPASTPPNYSVQPRNHHAAPVTLDDRVRLLTKELDLDAGQQAQLKNILLSQRAEVEKVWSDPSTSSSIRIGATRAISERTADRIRSILNDAQRAKYIQPRNHVQSWISSAQRTDSVPAGAPVQTAAKEN